MIVIKDKRPRVLRINLAAYTLIARTEVTIRHVFWKMLLFLPNCRTTPWSILSMCRNDNPFFPKGVPPFFPRHDLTCSTLVSDSTVLQRLAANERLNSVHSALPLSPLTLMLADFQNYCGRGYR